MRDQKPFPHRDLTLYWFFICAFFVVFMYTLRSINASINAKPIPMPEGVLIREADGTWFYRGLKPGERFTMEDK